MAAILSEFYGFVQSAGDYAARLWSDDKTEEVREEVTDRLLNAIANAYVLGQLVAMPSLAESKRSLVKTLKTNRTRHMSEAGGRTVA